MHCYQHPDRETQVTCEVCGNDICSECAIKFGDKQRCRECAPSGPSWFSKGTHPGEETPPPPPTPPPRAPTNNAGNPAPRYFYYFFDGSPATLRYWYRYPDPKTAPAKWRQWTGKMSLLGGIVGAVMHFFLAYVILAFLAIPEISPDLLTASASPAFFFIYPFVIYFFCASVYGIVLAVDMRGIPLPNKVIAHLLIFVPGIVLVCSGLLVLLVPAFRGILCVLPLIGILIQNYSLATWSHSGLDEKARVHVESATGLLVGMLFILPAFFEVGFFINRIVGILVSVPSFLIMGMLVADLAFRTHRAGQATESAQTLGAEIKSPSGTVPVQPPTAQVIAPPEKGPVGTPTPEVKSPTVMEPEKIPNGEVKVPTEKGPAPPIIPRPRPVSLKSRVVMVTVLILLFTPCIVVLGQPEKLDILEVKGQQVTSNHYLTLDIKVVNRGAQTASGPIELWVVSSTDRYFVARTDSIGGFDTWKVHSRVLLFNTTSRTPRMTVVLSQKGSELDTSAITYPSPICLIIYPIIMVTVVGCAMPFINRKRKSQL
jgi:hypothetical protein